MEAEVKAKRRLRQRMMIHPQSIGQRKWGTPAILLRVRLQIARSLKSSLGTLIASLFFPVWTCARRLIHLRVRNHLRSRRQEIYARVT